MPVPSEIVDIEISVETQAPTQDGFGTPLLLDYHTKWVELIRTYDADTMLTELTAEGFDSDSNVYRMAMSILRQDPHPSQVKVGRSGQTPAVFTALLTVDAAVVAGQAVGCIIVLPDGTEVPVSVVSTGTPATDATALELLTEAVTGLNSAATLAVITLTGANAGEHFRVISPSHLAVKLTTASMSFDDALTAIQAVDDDFYGVMIGINSEANLNDLIAWAETQTKIFFGHYCGTVADYLTWAATHSSEHRSLVIYTDEDKDSMYAGAEWGAYYLANSPGTIVGAFKQLPGIETTTLTSGQRSSIKTLKGNTYMTRMGVDITQDGWAPSGRYIDLTHALDFLEARTGEAVYGWLARQKKVPYTNGSVDIVRSLILGVLTGNIGTEDNPGPVAADPAPTCTGPDVRTISPSVKLTRVLPDIRFDFVLSNGIQAVQARGKATF